MCMSMYMYMYMYKSVYKRLYEYMWVSLWSVSVCDVLEYVYVVLDSRYLYACLTACSVQCWARCSKCENSLWQIFIRSLLKYLGPPVDSKSLQMMSMHTTLNIHTMFILNITLYCTYTFSHSIVISYTLTYTSSSYSHTLTYARI